jgi:hypothetical protein
MNRKIMIVGFCAALVFAFSAATSFATLINGFEGTKTFDVQLTAGDTYGWNTTTGVSEGSQAFQLTAPDAGWDQFAQQTTAPDSGGLSLADVLRSADKLQFEVTCTPEWWGGLFIAINANMTDGTFGHWTQYAVQCWSSSGTPLTTVTVDYSALKATWAPPGTFADVAQIFFMWQGGYNGTTTLTIDNLRTVPEPSTIILLSMGCLMGLLYWRKR